MNSDSKPVTGEGNAPRVITKETIRDIQRIPYRGHTIELYHYRDWDGEWLADCAIDGEFSQCEGVAARGNLTVEQAKQIIDEMVAEETGEGNAPRKLSALEAWEGDELAKPTSERKTPYKFQHHEYVMDIRNLTKGQVIESYVELKAQRDELLAAAEGEVISRLGGIESAKDWAKRYANDETADKALLALVAAIAKAEGV